MAGTVDIISDVAGRVWKIEVKPGAPLAPEDTVLILESMKMEIPVGAPVQGTLAELLVSEGDAVDEGQIVARLTVS